MSRFQTFTCNFQFKNPCWLPFGPERQTLVIRHWFKQAFRRMKLEAVHIPWRVAGVGLSILCSLVAVSGLAYIALCEWFTHSLGSKLFSGARNWFWHLSIILLCSLGPFICWVLGEWGPFWWWSRSCWSPLARSLTIPSCSIGSVNILSWILKDVFKNKMRDVPWVNFTGANVDVLVS